MGAHRAPAGGAPGGSIIRKELRPGGVWWELSKIALSSNVARDSRKTSIPLWSKTLSSSHWSRMAAHLAGSEMLNTIPLSIDGRENSATTIDLLQRVVHLHIRG